MAYPWRKSQLFLSVLAFLYLAMLSVLHLVPDARRPEVVLLANQEAASSNGAVSSRGKPDMDGVPASRWQFDRDGKDSAETSDKSGHHARSTLDTADSGQTLRSVVLRRLNENRGHSLQEETHSGHESVQFQSATTGGDSTNQRLCNDSMGGRFHWDGESAVEFVRLGTFYVYATFLDERLYPKSVFVRIFVLRPRQSSFSVGGDLRCSFNVGNDSSFSDRRKSRCVGYEMCENHGKPLGGWIYSCPLPVVELSQRPSQITVTYTDQESARDERTFHVQLMPRHHTTDGTGATYKTTDSENSPRATVTNLNHSVLKRPSSGAMKSASTQTSPNTNNAKNTQHLNKDGQEPSQNRKITQDMSTTISVCVPPLFGDIVLTQLVNFLEMCKLMGAHSVSLYIHDVEQHIVQFLRWYADRNPGFLSLTHWRLPDLGFSSSSSQSSSSSSSQSASSSSSSWWRSAQGGQTLWNRGQLLSVQHCLYRHMQHPRGRGHWVLFMDLDEMLVPHGESHASHDVSPQRRPDKPSPHRQQKQHRLSPQDWGWWRLLQDSLRDAVNTMLATNASEPPDDSQADANLNSQTKQNSFPQPRDTRIQFKNRTTDGDSITSTKENSERTNHKESRRMRTQQMHKHYLEDRIAALSFESAFFTQTFHTQATNGIEYFQHVHRTRTTYPARAKVMVRPREVFELGLHHLSKPLEGGGRREVRVSKEIGLLHHYRQCLGTPAECDVLVKDAAILRYEAALTIASRKVLETAIHDLWR